MVERGAIASLQNHLPERSGKVFVVTTHDVWEHCGQPLNAALSGRPFETIHITGGEANKRFEDVERAAEHMVRCGADRSSVVVAFGGGIVNDMAGFLAAIFMRGVPVVQVPTTLLAQVDAAVGGKTGVNLRSGKNLIGSFHQPLAVLIDPDVLETLPEREFRAGLYEVIKYGVIASPRLFELVRDRSTDVLGRNSDVLEDLIAESVRIKAEVVSADEKEGSLRKILNFGHTVGHAVEAETRYSQFLHGEAVAIGMNAATHLASRIGLLNDGDRDQILAVVDRYGPVPSADGLQAENLFARLGSDKKTIGGKVHFVLPDRIGHVVVRSGLLEPDIVAAIRLALR